MQTIIYYLVCMCDKNEHIIENAIINRFVSITVMQQQPHSQALKQKAVNKRYMNTPMYIGRNRKNTFAIYVNGVPCVRIHCGLEGAHVCWHLTAWLRKLFSSMCMHHAPPWPTAFWKS